MKVWTNNQFHGHWPVGTAAVVVAETLDEAVDLLNDALQCQGLGRVAEASQFEPLPLGVANAVILNNGDY